MASEGTEKSDQVKELVDLMALEEISEALLVKIGAWKHLDRAIDKTGLFYCIMRAKMQISVLNDR